MTEQQFEPFEAFQCWRIVHLALHRLEKTFGMTGGQRMNIVDRHHNDWTEARQKDIPSLQAMVDQFDETQMYSSDQLVEFYSICSLLGTPLDSAVCPERSRHYEDHR